MKYLLIVGMSKARANRLGEIFNSNGLDFELHPFILPTVDVGQSNLEVNSL